MELSLSSDICEIIASNFYEIEYELEDWVIQNKNFSYYKLSKNPNAIDFLRKNPKYIDEDELLDNKNPKAKELFELKAYFEGFYNKNDLDKSDINLISIFTRFNYDRIDWGSLFPKKNTENLIDYDLLSLVEKPESIAILRENLDKCNWYNLSSNKSKEAIELLKENPEKIVWAVLSVNPNAIKILRENQDKIDWEQLSCNTNPEILKLFTSERLMNLSRNYFSSNIGACEFLKTHPEYITSEIGQMPYIFKAVKKFDKTEQIRDVLSIVLSSSG